MEGLTSAGGGLAAAVAEALGALDADDDFVERLGGGGSLGGGDRTAQSLSAWTLNTFWETTSLGTFFWPVHSGSEGVGQRLESRFHQTCQNLPILPPDYRKSCLAILLIHRIADRLGARRPREYSPLIKGGWGVM